MESSDYLLGFRECRRDGLSRRFCPASPRHGKDLSSRPIPTSTPFMIAPEPDIRPEQGTRKASTISTDIKLASPTTPRSFPSLGIPFEPILPLYAGPAFPDKPWPAWSCYSTARRASAKRILCPLRPQTPVKAPHFAPSDPPTPLPKHTRQKR
eukprot:scaffold7381_cov310-Pinguiococcus_pyrenoidosus.AAC.140